MVQDASNEDATWIIGELQQQRPDVVKEAIPSSRPKVRLSSYGKDASKTLRPSPSLLIEMAEGEQDLVQQRPSLKNQQNQPLLATDKCVVQFGAEIYFVTEGDEKVVLNLLRIGNLDGTCSVKYVTKAVSAVAGVHFEDVQGILRFEPGETEAFIPVRIYDNDHWNNTVEFQVLLLPESCEDCILGQFLSTTRVKVIDDDTFPSNRCRDAVMEGDPGSLGLFTLYIDYVKICWQDPVIWYGSITMFLVDLLHIVYDGLQLLTNVYIVDKILKNDDLMESPEQATLQLCICAMLKLGPTILLHLLEYRKPTWKVPGRCRAFLQNALFRKFLDYDDCSRAKHQPGSTIMAETRDVQTVVADGYLSTLSLAKAVCSVIGMVIFKLIGNRLFGVALSPTLVIALIAFPAIIIPYVILRRNTLAQYIHVQAEAQDVLANTVSSSVDGFRLMYDYHQRAVKANEFNQSILAYNKATIDLVQVTANNQYFVHWIGAVVTAAYTVLRGAMVVSGDCPLGIYLMDIQIFLAMNVAFGNVFKVLMAITAVKPALERITHLLNLPTSLSSEKTFSLTRLRRTQGSALALGERKKSSENPDDLKIVLQNLRFQYPPGMDVDSTSHIQFDGEVELAQGQMIAIAGPPGQGKTTILKLLAGVLRPNDKMGGKPSVFVPSHLRALYVTVQPLFFFGTLLENLTYGIASRRIEDARPERVRAILWMLGLEERAIELLDSPAKLKWTEVFSFSQQCLLNLARALVFNPEILCVNYPSTAHNGEVRAKVFSVLREWVADKGVGLDAESAHLRRPRTCVFTCRGNAGVLAADKVVSISNNGTRLEMLERESFTAKEGMEEEGAARQAL